MGISERMRSEIENRLARTDVPAWWSDEASLRLVWDEVKALTAERDALEKRAIHAEEQFGLMRDERDALKAALRVMVDNSYHHEQCGWIGCDCGLSQARNQARRLLGLEGHHGA